MRVLRQVRGIWHRQKHLQLCYCSLSSYEVRSKFIDFFKHEHRHEFVPSSPVNLVGDPTLLFVNAGMNQFKRKFLGTVNPQEKLSSIQRAVNSQKCIRVGGKHNDLNDVGKDTTHHTFFEMLGSWSFGDYFKEQSCEMALTLLTRDYNLSMDRLYFTYFGGSESLEPDIETRNIWRSFGVPKHRILAFGPKDNFWEMGDTGPCGPCSEIHYDYIEHRRIASHLVNRDHPDVVEIWNLVFMQYNRLADKSLLPLPTHHVDTGLGLERLTAVLQGKRSNYDTDLFIPLIRKTEKICQSPRYQGGSSIVDQAYRIIADHVRMLVIAIGDNVYPGNNAEGLIVRQVLRRAYLQGKLVLNAPNGLLEWLCPLVISSLSSHFSYLQDKQNEILRVVREEEADFSRIIHKSETMFYMAKNKMKDQNFPIDTAILMHNHFGYPMELLLKAINENNLNFDLKKFYRYQESREELKRAGNREAERDEDNISVNIIEELKQHNIPFTDSEAKYMFRRIDRDLYNYPTINSTILAIIGTDGTLKEKMGNGSRCALVLDRTCFYHTDGGQEYDTGILTGKYAGGFTVDNVTDGGGYVFHHGLGGDFKVGDIVTTTIDGSRRLACSRAHTATHLLNYALRDVLGNVSQHGSRVGEDELRFTFFGRAPNHQDLKNIISIVNKSVDMDIEVTTQLVQLDKAIEDSNIRKVHDAIYSDPARMVSIKTSADGNHSVELCGGTHTLTSGDIKKFDVVSCKSKGKHKTTMLCLTSSRADNSLHTFEKLQLKVNKATRESNEILLASSVSLDHCEKMRKTIGLLNYEVNNAEISVTGKAELKEILRKHSQKLGTKIRKLHKSMQGQMKFKS